MKKWECPVMEELNIEMTASGNVPGHTEGLSYCNSHKQHWHAHVNDGQGHDWDASQIGTSTQV